MSFNYSIALKRTALENFTEISFENYSCAHELEIKKITLRGVPRQKNCQFFTPLYSLKRALSICRNHAFLSQLKVLFYKLSP